MIFQLDNKYIQEKFYSLTETWELQRY